MVKNTSSVNRILDILPFPLPAPTEWKILFELGKKAWEYVQELISEPEINDNSTVQDIESINTALIKLHEQMYDDGRKTIDAMRYGIRCYTRDLQFLLDERKVVLDKYNIRYGKAYQLIAEIEKGVESFWHDQIRDIFSLDNAECRGILMIPLGTRRENALKDFVKKSYLKIAEDFAKYMRYELNKVSDMFLEDITATVKIMESNTEQFEKLYADVKSENTKGFEQGLSEAELKCWICEKSKILLEE